MILTPEKKIENKKIGKTYIFLAGPIQGAPSWQLGMPELEGVVWLSPRRKSYDNFNWQEQYDWETFALRMADAVIFYVPEEEEKVPGRDYAQTTRTEIGEIVARGKKIFFCCNPSWPGSRYVITKLFSYGQTGVYDTFEALLDGVKDWMMERPRGIYFTSDTHFGSERALILSKRPFHSVREMDMTMMERWNNTVHPESIVYHLGDFGDEEWKKYLNGKIVQIKGNYDTEGIEGPVIREGYQLVHEPSKHTLPENVLFGHIHGRQLVKRYGLDVGVDAHDFRPISKDEVEFWMNAIKNHYDEEVFS